MYREENPPSLGGNVNGEATMKNSREVPWNTKHRGIVWSCSAFLCSGPEKTTIQNDVRTLTFRAALLQQPHNPPKHPLTEQCRLRGSSIHWNAAQPWNSNIMMLAAAWIDQEIITLYMLFREEKTNILRYHVQVESVSSYRWANLQNRNRLTD